MKNCILTQALLNLSSKMYDGISAHVVKDYTNKAKTDMFLSLSER